MQISPKCHERDLEALAPVESTTTLGQTTEKVCQRTTFHGRSARALNPLAESAAHLLQTICRGEFALHGFRNRDLCDRLWADETSLDQTQKRPRITRLIRRLRYTDWCKRSRKPTATNSPPRSRNPHRPPRRARG